MNGELFSDSTLFALLLEMLMKAKEEELNSIIMELRRNYEASQEKFAKEQSDKLVCLVEAMTNF